MILPFSKNWPQDMAALAGKPTYFVDKIWEGFFRNDIGLPEKEHPIFLEKHREKFNSKWDDVYDVVEKLQNAKIHTIRYNAHNRWKTGNDIHFYIHNRTPDAFQFAPVIPCTDVQNINISFCRLTGKLLILVDGSLLDDTKAEQLALNDGFDCLKHFECFFTPSINANGSFIGKIIHWTNFKY